MSKPEEILVSRRTTLRWLVASLASEAMLAGCGGFEEEAAVQALADLGVPRPADGVSYGTDPNVLSPVVPWEMTMTAAQRRITAALADAILPPGASAPAPSEVGVQDFLDEWVSAPYPSQRADREAIFDGLVWLEQESIDRFAVSFVDATAEQRSAILDDIAYRDRVKPGLDDAARFLAKFRHLVMSAYYSTEAGVVEIGYIGNTPIVGEYPGPTPEALAHLERGTETTRSRLTSVVALRQGVYQIGDV